jgi:hypothetical protein
MSRRPSLEKRDVWNSSGSLFVRELLNERPPRLRVEVVLPAGRVEREWYFQRAGSRPDRARFPLCLCRR